MSHAIEEAIQQRQEAVRERLEKAHASACAVAGQMTLMLHGGSAIEALVPGSVYGPDDVPDIDAFTSRGGNSKKTAYAAAGLLRKQGVDGLRVIPAVHKETNSVRIGRHVVMDISWLRPDEYRCLSSVASDEGVASLGVAPVAYLKMSMHLELCRPAVYIERWRKVWPRLQALYAAYPACMPEPLRAKKAPHEPLRAPDSLLAFVTREATDLGIVTIGRRAVADMTGSDIMAAWPLDLVVPRWRPFGQEHLETGDEHDRVVADLELRTGLSCAGKACRNTFGPPYRRLCSPDGTYVARVFLVDTEVSTAAAGGIMYGTSDLVLHLLYGEFLRTARPHTQEREALARAIDAVVEAQACNANAGIHRRFTAFNHPAEAVSPTQTSGSAATP